MSLKYIIVYGLQRVKVGLGHYNHTIIKLSWGAQS